MFAETSLMFADIVGFTQWSSCRVPSDVFTLLETIFAEFDGIANRRRVFKVLSPRQHRWGYSGCDRDPIASNDFSHLSASG
jgi:hypothetical protein